MDSTMETWAYENLYFYVNADGIDSMTYCNPYTIGETKTENLSLLPIQRDHEYLRKNDDRHQRGQPYL